MALDRLVVSTFSWATSVVSILSNYVILNWYSSRRSLIINIHLRLKYLPPLVFIACPEHSSLLNVLLLTMRCQKHRLGV